MKKRRLMLFTVMSLLAIGGAVTVVDNNTKEEDHVVVKAEAAQFPVIAKGREATRIQGDMVFIYFDNSKLQINGATKVSVTANLVCESTDSTLQPYVTGGNAAVVFQKFELVNDYDTVNNTARLYMTLDKGMADGIEFYHKFDLTITINETSTYTAHVEFKGNAYIDPNPVVEPPLTITETKEFSVLNDSTIGGAAVHLYVDNTEIGLTNDNYKSLEASVTFTTEAEGLKGYESTLKVMSAKFEDITPERFKIYLTLNYGFDPAAGKFTHVFDVSFVKKTSDTEGIAYKNSKIEFHENKLYDPSAVVPDEPTKLSAPYGFVANVSADNKSVTFAWADVSTTHASHVSLFVKDSKGVDVVGVSNLTVNNGKVFGKEYFVEGETYTAYIIARGDGVYYSDSDQSAADTFTFESEVVKNFVSKWAEMRKRGGENGICVVAGNEDSEFKALIEEFKGYTPEQQAEIRATDDVEGVTIGQTMDYLSGKYEWFRNQNVATTPNEANLVVTALNDDTLLLVAVIGLVSLLATVAYVYSEKKKFAKK